MADLSAVENFKKLLSEESINILTHKNPDGDTIGTAFALKKLFEFYGKKATVICSDKLSDRISFISEGKSELYDYIPNASIVAVHIASALLIGDRFNSFLNKIKYCIDHHFTHTCYAEISMIDSNSSSAGEFLFDLIKAAEIKINKEIAEKIYTAISSDTGCFKYSNVTPHTHIVASELLKYGINSEEINRKLFDEVPYEQILAESMILKDVDSRENGKIVFLTVTQHFIKSFNNRIDVDGFSSLCRRFKGVVVGITLKETETGTIRVSFRSMNDEINVAEIAEEFGGGGHKKASGCSFDCSIEEIKTILTDRCSSAIKKAGLLV